jgi:hypothetical protein
VQQHNTGVIFRSSDAGMPIAIRVFASGERDLDSFFANYLQLYILKGGLGFLPAFEARIDPTMYGSWRGDTVHGRGTYMGSEMIVAATAIRANDQIYLFQMLAPAFRSEEAYRQRERMARSLHFQSVPEQGRTTPAPGAVCTSCGADLSQTMEVLKSQTLRMMR